MYETWYKMTQMVLTGFPAAEGADAPVADRRLPAGFDLMEGGKSGKVVLSWN
jgi:threonine 3-dehydrogenase